MDTNQTGGGRSKGSTSPLRRSESIELYGGAGGLVTRGNRVRGEELCDETVTLNHFDWKTTRMTYDPYRPERPTLPRA